MYTRKVRASRREGNVFECNLTNEFVEFGDEIENVRSVVTAGRIIVENTRA